MIENEIGSGENITTTTIITTTDTVMIEINLRNLDPIETTVRNETDEAGTGGEDPTLQNLALDQGPLPEIRQGHVRGLHIGGDPRTNDVDHDRALVHTPPFDETGMATGYARCRVGIPRDLSGRGLKAHAANRKGETTGRKPELRNWQPCNRTHRNLINRESAGWQTLQSVRRLKERGTMLLGREMPNMADVLISSTAFIRKPAI